MSHPPAVVAYFFWKHACLHNLEQTPALKYILSYILHTQYTVYIFLSYWIKLFLQFRILCSLFSFLLFLIITALLGIP